MSRGFVTRMLFAPMRMKTIAQAVSEKMWYSGRAAIATSLPGTSCVVIHAPTCCMFATMLAWVSIAPLATPVVPPVYWRKAMSSWPMATSGNACIWPSVSASRKRTAPSMR